MMKNENIKIGVIITDFQVHQIDNTCYSTFIKNIKNDNDYVIIFLRKTYKSRINPLNFETRKYMIEDYLCLNQYNLNEFNISSLKEHKHDDILVKELDFNITKIVNYKFKKNDNFDICLYSEKDTFLDCYKYNNGKYKTKFININPLEIKEQISKNIINNSDFRKGIIYGQYDMYPACYSVVDIIVKKYINNDLYILLGQKDIDVEKNLWVFPGGFIDKNDGSARNAAKRELLEETNIDVDANLLKIFDNVEINDYRYKNSENSLFSTIFTLEVENNIKPVAKDDLSNVKWFLYSDVEKHISNVHYNIWNLYKNNKLN